MLNGRTALHVACESGNSEVVKALLNHPDINFNLADEKGNIPLQVATRC